MKKLYYSYLNVEGKKLFKIYCVSRHISSFKMQNYFSGNFPIPQDFKEWLFDEDAKEWLFDKLLIDNLFK